MLVAALLRWLLHYVYTIHLKARSRRFTFWLTSFSKCIKDYNTTTPDKPA